MVMGMSGTPFAPLLDALREEMAQLREFHKAQFALWMQNKDGWAKKSSLWHSHRAKGGRPLRVLAAAQEGVTAALLLCNAAASRLQGLHLRQ